MMWHWLERHMELFKEKKEETSGFSEESKISEPILVAVIQK